MSVKLGCDGPLLPSSGCAMTYEPPRPRKAVTSARWDAQKVGWVYSLGRDYCPFCIAHIRKQQTTVTPKAKKTYRTLTNAQRRALHKLHPEDYRTSESISEGALTLAALVEQGYAEDFFSQAMQRNTYKLTEKGQAYIQ